MKSRMLDRIKRTGLAACASLGLACGTHVIAAGDEAPVASKAVEKEGKDAAAASKSKSTEADAAKSFQVARQGLGSFGKVLPLGQKNRDVKIPSFRDGNPSSFVRAASMTRLDDEKMDMERLDIRMYGDTEEKDLRIMLPTATYDMATEVLSSEDRSRISRKDFDLQGDTLIFDTRTQQGKMTGHIHMIIRNPDSFRAQSDKPADAGPKVAVPPAAPEKPALSSEKK